MKTFYLFCEILVPTLRFFKLFSGLEFHEDGFIPVETMAYVLFYTEPQKKRNGSGNTYTSEINNSNDK